MMVCDDIAVTGNNHTGACAGHDLLLKKVPGRDAFGSDFDHTVLHQGGDLLCAHFGFAAAGLGVCGNPLRAVWDTLLLALYRCRIGVQ